VCYRWHVPGIPSIDRANERLGAWKVNNKLKCHYELRGKDWLQLPQLYPGQSKKYVEWSGMCWSIDRLTGRHLQVHGKGRRCAVEEMQYTSTVARITGVGCLWFRVERKSVL
jgi:hypothetical protein